MTREEAIKFLALVKIAYPTAYRDMDSDSVNATVNMWYVSFPDVPYPIIEIAFNNFRRKSKFAPTVAEIFTELKELYYKAAEGCFVADKKDSMYIEKCKYVMRHTEAFARGNNTIDFGAIDHNALIEDCKQRFMIETENN